MNRTRLHRMFTVVTQMASHVSLSYNRMQLSSRQQRKPQIPLTEAQVAPEVSHRLRESPLWFSVWPSTSTEHSSFSWGGQDSLTFADPLPLPCESPFDHWLALPLDVLNLDQLVNDMSFLQPVSTPHNISTQLPFTKSLSKHLTDLRQKEKFVSNWFISKADAKRSGMLPKNSQRFNFVPRVMLKKLYHASQLSNGLDMVKYPFNIRGTVLPITPFVEEVALRESAGSVGPHLIVSQKTLRTLPTVRLKPNAKEIIISTKPSFPAKQTPHLIHYYNIADVRLPSTFTLSSEVASFEAQNPGVPVDGTNGAQLLIDALINVPNIERAVWFSAHQLLQLGARCGVNAVPVVVSVEGGPVTKDVSWYHVEDTEDPAFLLSQVGKV